MKSQKCLATKSSFHEYEICQESGMCMYHCVNANHNHCANFSCSKIENICDNGMCFYHCNLEGHSHCKHKYCGNTVCDMSIVAILKITAIALCSLATKQIFAQICVFIVAKHFTLIPLKKCDEIQIIQVIIFLN